MVLKEKSKYTMKNKEDKPRNFERSRNNHNWQNKISGRRGGITAGLKFVKTKKKASVNVISATKEFG